MQDLNYFIAESIKHIQFLEQEIDEVYKKYIKPLPKQPLPTKDKIRLLCVRNILNPSKLELLINIFDLRNFIVHQYFLNKPKLKCFEIKELRFSDNEEQNFKKILMLIHETRDFILNKLDGANRPNYIDGSYDI